MMPAKIRRDAAGGRRFYDWPTPHGFAGDVAPGEKLCRFVTSFATTADEVDRSAS